MNDSVVASLSPSFHLPILIPRQILSQSPERFPPVPSTASICGRFFGPWCGPAKFTFLFIRLRCLKRLAQSISGSGWFFILILPDAFPPQRKLFPIHRHAFSKRLGAPGPCMELGLRHGWHRARRGAADAHDLGRVHTGMPRAASRPRLKKHRCAQVDGTGHRPSTKLRGHPKRSIPGSSRPPGSLRRRWTKPNQQRKQ